MITDFNPNFYCIFLGKVKQNLQKIDLNKLNLELQKLEKLVNQQNFWQTPQAKEIMQQLGMITKKIDKVKNIKQSFQ